MPLLNPAALYGRLLQQQSPQPFSFMPPQQPMDMSIPGLPSNQQQDPNQKALQNTANKNLQNLNKIPLLQQLFNLANWNSSLPSGSLTGF
jgi:hypothetical protein